MKRKTGRCLGVGTPLGGSTKEELTKRSKPSKQNGDILAEQQEKRTDPHPRVGKPKGQAHILGKRMKPQPGQKQPTK